MTNRAIPISISGELNIIYLYMVDSPLHCDYVTITRWIALRSGLKGLVTAVAPLITARVHRVGAGWICVAGTVLCQLLDL